MRSALPWLIIAAVVLAAGAAIVRLAQPRIASDDAMLAPLDSLPGSAEVISDTDSPDREVYRYSVIPGGVYTPQELFEATERDAVAYGQYGTIERASMRATTVDTPRRAYMSYRIGDNVYWTKKPLALKAGETVLTNGTVEIRARCGNQISQVPMTPVSPEEPAAVEFEQLVDQEPGTLAALEPPGAAGRPIDVVGQALPPLFSPPAVPPMTVADPVGGGDPPVLPPGWGTGGSGRTPSGAPSNDVYGPPGVVASNPPAGPPAGGGKPGTGGPPTSFPADPPPGSANPPGSSNPPTFSLDPPAVPPGPPSSTPPPLWIPSDDPGTEWTPPLPPGDPSGNPPADPPPGWEDPVGPDEEVPGIAVVPEPGTFLLLGSALTGIGVMVVRKRLRARKEAAAPPAD